MARKKHQDGPAGPRSTDLETARALFPLAVDFAKVTGLAQTLELPLGASGVKAVAEALGSEERITRALEPLPAATLWVLELAADLGGGVVRDDLVALAENVGLAGEALDVAIDAAMGACLVFVVERRRMYYSESDDYVVLPLHGALAIARRVQGISVPEPPLASPTANTSPLRDILAVLTLPAHHPVKLTLAQLPNRTSLKRVAGALSMDIDTLERAFWAGLDAGVLGMRDGLLAPAPEALRRHDGTTRGAVASYVGSEWTSLERIARFRAGVLYAQSPELAHQQWDDTLVQLPTTPGVERCEHEGHTFVRRIAGGPATDWRAGSGDGHVTPSLEVMLGPDCHPRLALEVGLFAELVRIDRVLTFKLTRDSVAAGASLGLDLAHMLAVLDRVGRHAVPDNVQVTVRDFAKAARFVTIWPAQVLTASSVEAADRLASELGDKVLERPTPTMILVAAAEKDVANRAARAGVPSAGQIVSTQHPLEHGPVTQRALPERRPTPSLRARFLASKDALATTAPTRGPSGIVAALLAAATDEPVRAMLTVALELWREVEAPFAVWMKTLDLDDHNEALLMAQATPLAFAPLLMMEPVARDATFARSKTLEALVRRMTGEHRDSFAGRRLGKLMRHPAAERYFFESISGVVHALGSLADGEAAPRIGSPPSEKAIDLVDGRPRAADLGAQSTAALRSALDGYVSTGTDVWLRVRSKSGERVLHYLPEQLLTRGREVTLLGTDLDDEASRSFPLNAVIAARPTGFETKH